MLVQKYITDLYSLFHEKWDFVAASETGVYILSSDFKITPKCVELGTVVRQRNLNRSRIKDILIIFIFEKEFFIFIVFYPLKTQFPFLLYFTKRMLTSPYILGDVRGIFYATQAGCIGETHTSQPHLGGKIQNWGKKEIEFSGGKTQLKWKILSQKWILLKYLWYNFCFALIRDWRRSLISISDVWW